MYEAMCRLHHRRNPAFGLVAQLNGNKFGALKNHTINGPSSSTHETEDLSEERYLARLPEFLSVPYCSLEVFDASLLMVGTDRKPAFDTARARSFLFLVVPEEERLIHKGSRSAFAWPPMLITTVLRASQGCMLSEVGLNVSIVRRLLRTPFK